MKLAKRAGMKKAKVALARKLAVILHRRLAARASRPNAFVADLCSQGVYLKRGAQDRSPAND